MLSYQHAYHAGNAADVHKHALLASALGYMVRKDKPLVYMETHAGRALYDLESDAARKTGEAAQGIDQMERRFPADHPYRQALNYARALAGPRAYPGSPKVAECLLRDTDRMVLAEMHPQEWQALVAAMPGADVRQADGPALAISLTPPTPRRGFCLIDPSYEMKTEYPAMPVLLSKLHRKWPVGVLALWYPILANGAERRMVTALKGLAAEKTLLHEVRFPPARPGHGMIGSGMFFINPPFGLTDDVNRLTDLFAGR